MKVLCSHEVVSPYRCEVVPCQGTAKASAPQVPRLVLCLWLQKGVREDVARPKPIDFYAFSCGSFWKPARNLIEIAHRKSQLLLILFCACYEEHSVILTFFADAVDDVHIPGQRCRYTS